MKKLIMLFAAALATLALPLHAETTWTKIVPNTYEIAPQKDILCRVEINDAYVSFYAHNRAYYAKTAVETELLTKQENGMYAAITETYVLVPHVKGSYPGGTGNMLLFKDKSVPDTMDKVAGGYNVFAKECAKHVIDLPSEVQSVLNGVMLGMAAH